MKRHHPWSFVMADNLKERAPQDASRISLSEELGGKLLDESLRRGQKRLEELVSQHGNSADAVRHAIGK
jgi:hypothetical protein